MHTTLFVCLIEPILELARDIQEKEAAKFQEFKDRERKTALESFRRETKQRISEIPDMIRSVIEATIKYGYENKVGALSSSDHSLGLEHIPSKLDKSVAENAILEFEAVKTVLGWAVKKGFQYEISICNGYWELFLTW